MIDITHYPTAIFLLTGPLMWLTTRWGVRLSRRYPLDEEMRQDYGVLQGAALTLLGLLVAFSFSMAAGRYEQRKNLEEAEANAIGTEYARAAILPAADADKIRKLLKSYLQQRIDFYSTSEEVHRIEIDRQTAKLQDELWQAVLVPASANHTPLVALVVGGMNDVLNSQSYTQAAWWNRLPASAWGLLVAIALCSNFLVGYGSRSFAKAVHLGIIFPLFIAVALAFIADIDSPRHGIIRVHPQNLMSLAASLPAS
jgi:hypothetical protein